MSERCVRCGEEGEDRRTLRMACFYAMDELNVPFVSERAHGTLRKRTGTKELSNGLEIPVFSEEPTGELNAQMFSLRVCKACRASWMGAIERWFHSEDKPRRVGTGIFVRENGVNVEITREEWEARRGR